jgi:hypothetical protein
MIGLFRIFRISAPWRLRRRPGLVFRKYKVAPRVGTEAVRRRLLERLCLTDALVHLQPRSLRQSFADSPTKASW